MAYFKDLKCKTCKKNFAIVNIMGYAYKIKSKSDGLTKYFCSWICLQKYKKLHNLFGKLKYTEVDKWGNYK